MRTPPTGPTGPGLPLPVATPVARSEPLATWRVGQILAATVVANPQSGVADLRIGSLLVKAQTGALNLTPGQNLRLEVASLKELPVLKLLGLMQQPPIAQALRDVLPRQQPLPLLFTALANLATPTTAQRNPTLSPEIVRLAQVLFAKLPDPARVATADGLRQAIRNSGLFLESKLARSAAQAALAQTPNSKPQEFPGEFAQDFKANLLRLVQAIRDNVANSAPAGTRPSPTTATGNTASTLPAALARAVATSLPTGATTTPASTAPTTAQATSLTALAAAATRLPLSAVFDSSVTDIGAPLQRGLPPLPPLALAQLVKGRELVFSLNELQRFAEGALARVQLHQLSSLPQGPQERAPLPEWLIELPLRRDNETDVWSLRIGRDAHRERDNPTDTTPAWSVMLAFDLPGIGPMQSRVSLRGDRITAQFFSQVQGVLPLVAEHLPLLQARLQQAGLRVEELTCHHGQIPPPAPPPKTHILDERA